MVLLVDEAADGLPHHVVLVVELVVLRLVVVSLPPLVGVYQSLDEEAALEEVEGALLEGQSFLHQVGEGPAEVLHHAALLVLQDLVDLVAAVLGVQRFLTKILPVLYLPLLLVVLRLHHRSDAVLRLFLLLVLADCLRHHDFVAGVEFLPLLQHPVPG